MITDPSKTEAHRAFELYCERGVIVDGYSGEIAERKSLLNDWRKAGQPLR